MSVMAKIEREMRAEIAWSAYDSLTNEFGRFLEIAYQRGYSDGRNGAQPKPLSRDEIRRSLNSLRRGR